MALAFAEALLFKRRKTFAKLMVNICCYEFWTLFGLLIVAQIETSCFLCIHSLTTVADTLEISSYFNKLSVRYHNYHIRIGRIKAF
jgi:hypothetical protein